MPGGQGVLSALATGLETVDVSGVRKRVTDRLRDPTDSPEAHRAFLDGLDEKRPWLDRIHRASDQAFVRLYLRTGAPR